MMGTGQFTQPSYAQSMQPKGKEVATEHFDEAAFERAFDQARMDMMNGADEMETGEAAYENGASTGSYDEGGVDQVMREVKGKAALREYQDELMREDQQSLRNLHHLEHVTPPLDRLESDPVAEEMLREDVIQAEDEEKEAQKRAEDDDALALTAQELLEKVEHNQTDKFRNSQFLSLMRKLRDREVKVEGDQMVETNNVRSTLSNGKPIQPNTFTPDSTYGSGTATPEHLRLYPPAFLHNPNLLPRRSPPPEFDTHEEYGWGEEHEFDHWESPYR